MRLITPFEYYERCFRRSYMLFPCLVGLSCGRPMQSDHPTQSDRRSDASNDTLAAHHPCKEAEVWTGLIMSKHIGQGEPTPEECVNDVRVEIKSGRFVHFDHSQSPCALDPETWRSIESEVVGAPTRERDGTCVFENLSFQ